MDKANAEFTVNTVKKKPETPNFKQIWANVFIRQACIQFKSDSDNIYITKDFGFK